MKGQYYSVMSKKHKSKFAKWFGNEATVTHSTGWSEHTPEQHKRVDIYKGSVQATSGADLKTNFKLYDLAVFLADSTMSYLQEVPFGLGIPPIQVKNKILLYPFRDHGVPKQDFFFDWVIKYLTSELKKGARIGMACHGGHGRTGTILSILWGLANQKGGVPTMNPILAVRELVGCQREVEDSTQEDFIYTVTGYPAPAEKVIKKYVASTGGSYSNGWWDKDGKYISSVLSFEPSLFEKEGGTLVYKEKSAIDHTYLITPDGKWAIPLRTDSNGEPPSNNRMPEFLCDVCTCAKGFAMPLHKGSHKVCTVCPILKERGITRERPKAPDTVTSTSVVVKGATPPDCLQGTWHCSVGNLCPRHEITLHGVKSPKALPPASEVTSGPKEENGTTGGQRKATVANCPTGYLYCSFEEPCERHQDIHYSGKTLKDLTEMKIDPLWKKTTAKLETCDNCAKGLDLARYVTAFLDDCAYQFCNDACTTQYCDAVHPKKVSKFYTRSNNNAEEQQIHDKVQDLMNKYKREA